MLLVFMCFVAHQDTGWIETMQTSLAATSFHTTHFIGNGPFIDGLPIKNMGIFHGYVSHNQMVASMYGYDIQIISKIYGKQKGF